MWKQKEASNKKVLATQLGGVSKVISSVAEDIVGANALNKIMEQPKFKIDIRSSDHDKK